MSMTFDALHTTSEKKKTTMLPRDGNRSFLRTSAKRQLSFLGEDSYVNVVGQQVFAMLRETTTLLFAQLMAGL